ncbi:tetratricopeptide repeat protein [Terrimonas sp. NA20]|uniref:Tetratricopeptide repeat protein n=1 Tax=Terrimonas ginsenosidimutans TaxID=2908004 RepID=A0ABS9KZI3_9BACT|nr:tetratricopeptide repeat protein [Terrimonas ginsenosidimutans]MCG2617757.1 tetratricopeptide repeat protein [Terrimonas ginsenosidimutans]
MLRIPFYSLTIFLLGLSSCRQPKGNIPSSTDIDALTLKKGKIISCGADQQFGLANLEMSCDKRSLADFRLAVSLLHSFEYDEAEKAFAKVIDETPGCSMAYWGVAMSNFHALWAPPAIAELKKGSKAIEIANSITNKTSREQAYIKAIDAYYAGWETVSHKERCKRYADAMEKLHAAYPSDKEAAAFYALSLVAAADPSDKTYTNQLKAGTILSALYPGQPDHPGIVHYIIHTYDYPEIAQHALTAARKYAGIAPSSAHALHMPSHIFTRLGLWDECIRSNQESVSSAQCYAEETKIGKHWDEELHGLDYLVYAYLQKGDNDAANRQLQYLNTIKEVKPTNFKVAYSFAAIPARILLENKDWKAAAQLLNTQTPVNWKEYPWQESITHFSRLLGAAHTRDLASATKELQILKALRDTLLRQNDSYKAQQVDVQILTGEAWIEFQSGKKDTALKRMIQAADLEDKTEKHPVTPGEILPARELLGDLLMEMNRYTEALSAYERSLKKNPARFNSLYGAALAASKTGNPERAASFARDLINQSPGSKRAEVLLARDLSRN